jgi:type IV pilus assembly protein PilX
MISSLIAKRFRNGPRSQAGAALVVGLMLLVVITLLAIAGMNTSTLELQMAGNVQFRQNAFQAAETGLAVVRGDITKRIIDGVISVPVTTMTSGQPETYKVDITQSCADGMWGPAPPGYSITKDQKTVFDAASTGTSARGAKAVVVESFYEVTPKIC